MKKDDVVLDLGTGTGILAEMALQAGAKKVYGIEMTRGMLEYATISLQKKFKDRFVPVLGESFSVELPERVDLIISEVIGNIGDNEGMRSILFDARKRFLKENGTMIPHSVTSYFMAVEGKWVQEKISKKEIETYEHALVSDTEYYDVLISTENELTHAQEGLTMKFDKDIVPFRKKSHVA